MERLRNKAARKYLRQIRGLLPCSGKIKDEITAPLLDSLSGYLSEHPTAELSDFCSRFGSPETVAAMCLENSDTASILRRLQIRRKILSVVVITAILLLLTWVGFLLHTTAQIKSEVIGGYDETSIHVIYNNTSDSVMDTSNTGQ